MQFNFVFKVCVHSGFEFQKPVFPVSKILNKIILCM